MCAREGEGRGALCCSQTPPPGSPGLPRAPLGAPLGAPRAPGRLPGSPSSPGSPAPSRLPAPFPRPPALPPVLATGACNPASVSPWTVPPRSLVGLRIPPASGGRGSSPPPLKKEKRESERRERSERDLFSTQRSKADLASKGVTSPFHPSFRPTCREIW